MTFAAFPARPARASADLGRELAPFTSTTPVNRDFRRWPVPNPWIAGIGGMFGANAGFAGDERHWLRMERDPAVSGAQRQRISQLIGGGMSLEPGEGDGAAELFDFWSWALPEIRLNAVITIGLRGIFRGWECFEIVGARRSWEGREVFAPILLRDALTWQFRWTAGRDLIFTPPAGESIGYAVSTALPAKMKWWTPRFGSLSNPYGHPMHADFAVLSWAMEELQASGMVQIKQANGFLKVKHMVGDLEGALSEGDEAAAAAAAAKIQSFVAKLQAGGILYQPDGWTVEWESLTAAVGEWIKLFGWGRDQAATFYSGGNLTSQVSGSVGSRAIGEVQERQGRNLAAVDANAINDEFRHGFLRPWSAWNASVIAPEAFLATAATPRLEDVPLRAIPSLSFNSLTRLRPEDLEVLRLIAEIGVIDGESSSEGGPDGDTANKTARIDVRAIFESHRFPLLDDGEEGPTFDLSRRDPMAAPPFAAEPEAADGEDELAPEPGEDEPDA